MSLPEEMVKAQLNLAKCFAELVLMHTLDAYTEIRSFQAAYFAAVDQQQAAFTAEGVSYGIHKFFDDCVEATEIQLRRLLEGEHETDNSN
jgi:hypothetical protein